MPLMSRPSPPGPEVLLAKLQEINAEHGYLPGKELRLAASELVVPLSQLYSIATFDKATSLTSRGRHRVNACLGVACHVRDGVVIMETAEEVPGIKTGGTTSDQQFTLGGVNYLYYCSLGPVITVDGEYQVYRY